MKTNLARGVAPQNGVAFQGGMVGSGVVLALCFLGAVSTSPLFAGSPPGEMTGSPSAVVRQAAKDNDGLATDPVELVKHEIAADDGAAGDSFGYLVSLYGRTAVVGAPAATIGSNQAQGAVYVFRHENGTWTQVQKLTASDGAAFDDFGNSVAFDGKTLLVGAPDAAVNGNAGQGAAYVFTQSAGVFSQTQKLLASDGAFGNEFGDSVAVKGDTALIGAIQLLHGNGAAYVFNNAAGAWSESQKLTAQEGAATFGDAVALDGNNALIGAQQTSVGGFFDQGAAFIFANKNGTWTETAELLAGDGTMFDSLGCSVALDGSTALVGASGTTISGKQTGAAYVFTASGDTWQKTQRITADDARVRDGFGSSVALRDGTALIGADQYASNGTGKVYVFEQTADTWTQESELMAAQGARNDEFGWSVALDHTTGLIGAWGATIRGQSGQGATYIWHHLPGS